MRRLFLTAAIPVFLFLSLPLLNAQQPREEARLHSYVESVEHAGKGMTLWEILASGGVVMIILGVLSLVMMALVLYLSMRLNPARLVPQDRVQRYYEHIRHKRFQQAAEECTADDSMVSSIVAASLNEIDRGSAASRDAAEQAARKEIAGLWNGLNYISDIVQVAPMLGLLGTVLGMIQAFNTIAFDAAAVKPILLAGGVSKAMVTTAAGLVVAITAMFFYSILRIRAQTVTRLAETATARFQEAFER